MTQRVAALHRDLLVDAVRTSSSWREVGRRLDLRAARDLGAVRRRCDDEGVDASHLPGPQADAALAAAVRSAGDWEALLGALGYAASGSARATVRGRARRLGLDLAHLDRGVLPADDLVVALGGRRPELLRTAAPALVAAELLQRGCGISWPLEPVAYDLVAHLPQGGVLRVQVKSSTVFRHGTWEARLLRADRRAGGAYSADEIDAFGVVDGDRVVHLVPVAVLEGQTSVCSSAITRFRLLA